MSVFCYLFGRIDQGYITAKYFSKDNGRKVALHIGQYVDEEDSVTFYKDDKNPVEVFK